MSESKDAVQRQDFLDGIRVPTSPGERGQTLDAASALHGMAFRGQSHRLDGPASEAFDLVVAGAGLSGLSAAMFYRQRFGSDKRILLLDAMEDFGGHAKRNVFQLQSGKVLIGYGGSESLQSPKSNFSPLVHQLLKDLRVDIDAFPQKYFKQQLFPEMKLSRGSFFDGDKRTLVSGDPTEWVSDDIAPHQRNAKSIEAFVAEFPFSGESKKQLVDLFTSARVTLAHLNSQEARVKYLSGISYTAFLQKDWNMGAEAISYFRNRTVDFFGLSPQHIPALDCAHFGYPGFQSIDIPEDLEAKAELEEPYVFHFPDGNASIARLLVRALIPAAAAGDSMEDIVTAKFDYGKLDAPHSSVRIRLQSPVVRAENRKDGTVSVGYIDASSHQILHVQAKHVVLACFNMAIPYILPDLSEEQRKALKLNVKAPMVYTNVAVRNWQPWVKAGVHDIFCVNSFHSRIKLDYPVSIGGYQCSTDPSQPTVLHLVHVPVVDNERDVRASLRAARKTFFVKKFEDYEKAVRQDLTRALGPAGFDADRDILGITVNRWSHGYAFAQNSLAEQDEAAEMLRAAATKPHGNITFANSDSAWSAYAHSAIDEAHRAVQQLQ